MSPVPERSARQQRLRCRQAQEALSAVWLSGYPPHPTWEATRDEGSRRALVSEWHLHASPRVPPASIGPVRAQLAKTFAQEPDEKPEPTSRAIISELDERWHSLKEKRRKLWIWTALDRDTGQLVDWECGRRDKATLKKLVDRLVPWDVKVYDTDNWATDVSVIPQDTLVQSKAMTHEIKRHHGRQRHWFGRFKRKSIIVSTSKERVDLTMALFAKFWVNGNQDELLSLLG